MTWAGAMPGLLRKIDVVLELPYITETQTLDIELIAVRVGAVIPIADTSLSVSVANCIDSTRCFSPRPGGWINRLSRAKRQAPPQYKRRRVGKARAPRSGGCDATNQIERL
jgi:hypothetical protein